MTGALLIVVAIAAVGLFIWYFETHRTGGR
jgi:hypothetical protein